MDNGKTPEQLPPRPPGVPRWLAIVLAPIVLLIGVPAVHAGIPWLLSHLGPRFGWSDGSPSVWNLIGIVSLASGAILLLWILIFDTTQNQNLPEWVPTDWRPVILMTGGPYALSRNPMYIAELSLWLGMSVLFGSPVVMAGFAIWIVVMRRLAVKEELGLEAAYGELYLGYKARVPRWLFLPRRA
ncbi:MAG: isoprenylcysteine carboxylmethyltransferase family protein [Anaerolineaceae bacterium]